MTICCYGHLVANFFDCPAVLRGPPHLSAMNLCFAFLLGEIYWPIKIIQRFVMERGEGRPSKQKYSDGSGTRNLVIFRV